MNLQSVSAPSLLTLPPELRNTIYGLLFCTSEGHYTQQTLKSRNLRSLDLPATFGKDATYTDTPRTPRNNVPLLLCCRQLHRETHLLYLRTTPFYLIGCSAEPTRFRGLISAVPNTYQSAIRHIVLTAKIAHLRSLNEQWNSIPFGHENIHLDVLTIVPKRPETRHSAYAEVADLSQSHTLAYILAETLKGLRNVKRVVVRNEGCFTEVVWRLVYRSLVYRLWKWGGRLCGLGFRERKDEVAFEILCGCGLRDLVADGRNSGDGEGADCWRDVLAEVNRLIGAEGSRDGMREEHEHDDGSVHV